MKSAQEITEYPACMLSKGACGLGKSEKPTIAKLKTTGGIHRLRTRITNEFPYGVCLGNSLGAVLGTVPILNTQ